ncbi:CYFA0S11e00166g1_1 [Cyberlindnera fabianii]|uniref:CYFA0S11e00166g1_1 n=1 Tax=Cyberlindnera fabianii TaxID=36022 RepID=A0A061B0T8_CYBFA|nr:CYFA0S11e00166g1_1 [Cyberlindnera fabianii]
MTSTASIFSTTIFGLVVRSLQIFFGFLTWVLEAPALADFSHDGSIVWLLIVGLISMIYTITLIVLSFLFPGLIIPGAVMILEAFCAVANFTGFIALAAKVGDLNCNILGWYGYGSAKNSCGAAKAGIAFSAFNWVLFTLTAFIFGWYALKSISATKGSNQVWVPTKTSGVILSKYALTSVSTADVDDKDGSIPATKTAASDEETRIGESLAEKEQEPELGENTTTAAVVAGADEAAGPRA